MLFPTNCGERRCKHLSGVIQPDGTEKTERWVCDAFPEKIPEDIAYGPNKHLTPLPGQDNDIVYERGEREEP